MRVIATFAALGVLATTALAWAGPTAWPSKAQRAAKQHERAAWSALEKRVAAATVSLPDLGCAGAVVRTAREVATAAHCVPDGAASLRVVLPDGKTTRGTVKFLDESADLALLSLDAPAPVTPLSLATALPARGTRLLFVGRTDHPVSSPQITRVERLGRCPSLPLLPHAVFTTLDAHPGDSGSPLVNVGGQVVALVHGGARCEIAVPTAALSRQKSAIVVQRQMPKAPASRDSSPKRDGFVYEKTPNGFRFHWSFHWQSGG